MQTEDVLLTGALGRPETLCQDRSGTVPGLRGCQITYLILNVPVDVPIFDVLSVARHQLSCRANPAGIYHFTWSLLARDRPPMN